MTVNTRLIDALESGRKVVTAECRPPAASDAETVSKLAARLPDALDAIVVADNPDEVRGSAMATAAVLAGEGRGPVLTMTTRDRNRIALESDVLGAACLGVESILCVSGDHQSLGICPSAAGAYDMDCIQLSLAIKRMSDEGLSFDGQALDSAPKLLIGATAQPYLRPMGLNLIRLKKKIAAGAKFVFTQAVFDVGGLTEWLEALAEAGLADRVKIIASVLPLTGADKARRLQASGTYGPVSDEVVSRIADASDPAGEGIAIAAEAATELNGLGALAGIHILCGGCEEAAAEVIDKAGLATV